MDAVGDNYRALRERDWHLCINNAMKITNLAIKRVFYGIIAAGRLLCSTQNTGVWLCNRDSPTKMNTILVLLQAGFHEKIELSKYLDLIEV